jgi:hypothetical protein
VGCLSYKLYRLFQTQHSFSVTIFTPGFRLFFILLQINLTNSVTPCLFFIFIFYFFSRFRRCRHWDPIPPTSARHASRVETLPNRDLRAGQPLPGAPAFAGTGGPADTVFFPGFGGASTGTPCRPRLVGTPRAWKRSPIAICARGSRFDRLE